MPANAHKPRHEQCLCYRLALYTHTPVCRSLRQDRRMMTTDVEGGTGPSRCRENVGRVTIDTNGVGRLKEQVLTAAATYICDAGDLTLNLLNSGQVLSCIYCCSLATRSPTRRDSPLCRASYRSHNHVFTAGQVSAYTHPRFSGYIARRMSSSRPHGSRRPCCVEASRNYSLIRSFNYG